MNIKNKIKKQKFLLLLLILLFGIQHNVIHAQGTYLELKGIVIDAVTDEPLIGASVVEKGTTNGVITNIDGEFKIKVATDATLVISYVGYEETTVKVTGTTMTIKLKESSAILDEVVVVGYGVQKKSVVTAAISQVKGDKLEKVSPTRVDDVLKGMVSGVNITSSSGQPGAKSKVRIRGIGTINNSDPLYIIDGVPVGGGIDYLNPADIESVEVLKDAASAAIYGARAANGVILVTTKKGKSGKASINYNFSYGWQNPWKKRSVLNATEYTTLINEMLMNDGGTPRYDNPQSYGKGTDWQNELFNENAPIVQHQVSVNGGNETMSYFVSFGYFNREGVIGGDYKRSNYDRYSIRMNNSYILFDNREQRSFLSKMTLGNNLSYARVKSTGISENSEFGSPLGSALTLSPILSVYSQNPVQDLIDHPNAVVDKNGNVYMIPGEGYNEIINPIASLNLPGEKGNSDKFVGNFWAELELYKHLKFKTSYGFDLAFWGTDGYRVPYYLGKTNQNSTSAVWSSMNRGYTWITENTLTYDNAIGDHNFTVLLGQSAQSYRYRTLSGTSYGLSDPSRPYIDLTETANGERDASGKMSPYDRLASYFARLSYNYNERYMAEFTIRKDGSDRFGPNNKWATFPSASFGWNITNEKFMENKIAPLSTLKLRASWGKNGNQAIDPFRYVSMMQGGNNYIVGKEGEITVLPGFKPNGYPNQDIKWEESEQIDLGFDSNWLNGALTFSADWYRKTTNGMLMTMALPEYIGDTRPIGNVGKMRNTGLEFDVSYRFDVSDVHISIGANASYMKNTLVELGNDTGWQLYDSFQGVGSISKAQNGEPFPFFYGYKTAGIFQTWDEVNAYVNEKGEKLQPNARPGDVIFVDTNDDGSIDDEDRVKIGKGMPDWMFGFNVSAEWKGFDVSALFNGTIGNDIFDASRRTDLTDVNLPDYMLDRWTGAGTSNTIPRLTSTDANENWRSSDLYVHNGSFLRLRSLQLGYTIPRAILNKAMISNLRLYIMGENLLTFTSYKGFDPEISSGGTSLGIDKGVYPQSRTISVGVNVAF